MNLNTIGILFTALQLSTAVRPVLASKDTEVLIDTELQNANFTVVGGHCVDANIDTEKSENLHPIYSWVTYTYNITTSDDCQTQCREHPNEGLVGLEYAEGTTVSCACLFDKGYLELEYSDKPAGAVAWGKGRGSGAVHGTYAPAGPWVPPVKCMKNENFNVEGQAPAFVSVLGKCQSADNQLYDWIKYDIATSDTSDECATKCGAHSNKGFVGFEYKEGAIFCRCLFNWGYLKETYGDDKPNEAVAWKVTGSGQQSGYGTVRGTSKKAPAVTCMKNLNYDAGTGPPSDGSRPKAAFKLLPEDKELFGRVKDLLRGQVDTVGRDQGEGTEVAGPVPVV